MTTICNQLIDGKSLATICKTDDSVPGKRTVLRHIQENDDAYIGGTFSLQISYNPMICIHIIVIRMMWVEHCVPRTYTKSGVYYYVRRVPKDVQKHYARDRVVICLKTKSLYSTTRASRSVNAKLEDFWLSLRLQQISVPAHHLLQYQYSPISSISEICGITMSYAMELYFKLKGHGRGSLFFSHVRRAFKYAIDLLSDKDISLYSTTEASR